MCRLTLLLIPLLVSSSAFAATVYIVAAADRQARDFDVDGVWSFIDPDTNTILRAGYDEAPFQEFRSAMEFDLTSIPTGAVVSAVSVSLFVSQIYSLSTVDVYGYAGNGIIELSDMEGGTALASFPTIVGATEVALSPAFFQNLLSGGSGFAGLRVQWGADQERSSVQIRSSEFSLVESRPTLTLEYSAVPEPSVALQFMLGLVGLASQRRASAYAARRFGSTRLRRDLGAVRSVSYPS